MAAQKSSVRDLQVGGVLPFKAGEPTEAQVIAGAIGFMHMRNTLTGIESDDTDPWPCKEGSEFLGFLNNDASAYPVARDSLKKQGFVREKETRTEGVTDTPNVVFHMTRKRAASGGAVGQSHCRAALHAADV